MGNLTENIMDVCFPVPENLSLNVPDKIDSNMAVKKHIFQQTIQGAYQKQIPYNFTSSYNKEDPYQLVTEKEIATVVSLFQALQPKDALELALAQQFIITHIQAVQSALSGMSESDVKKFELTHKILETLMKYRSKFAQLIQVNYNHNEGQVNDIKIVKEDKSPETIEVNSKHI